MFWIPFSRINSVYNSNQVLFSPRKNCFHAASETLSLNLFGITLTDGCQHIRIQEASFEKTDLSVKLKPFHSKLIPRKTGKWYRIGWKIPLISQIVNGENRLCFLKKSVSLVERFQIDR